MTTFLIPDDVNFECQQCGMCCRQKWTIPLDDEVRERWKDARLLAVFPDVEERFAPFESPPFHHKLLKRENGACTFLTDQNTCALHARVDREHKPKNCILFPYHFVRTPRGVTAGFCFDCTGVNFEGNAARAGLDPAILEDHFGHALVVRELPKIFRYHETGPEVGYEVYEKVLQVLMRFLDGRTFPLEDGLIAGSILLQIADEFLRPAVAKGYPVLKAMGAFFRNVEDQDHALIRRLIKTVAVPADDQHAFFEFLVQSHEATSDSSERREMATLLISQARKRGRDPAPWESKFLGRTVDVAGAREVTWPADEEPVVRHLRLYLRHLVFRHVLTEHFPSLQHGHLYLMIVYGLVRWYARAIAHGLGAPAAESAHVREAVRIVETNYVFSSKLHQKLMTQGSLKKEMDRLLADRLTPYRLIRSE